MKITIIYDNIAFEKNLQADWGFSALIEAENIPKILFDTGANGLILLNNMKKLGINPKSIEEVFISHAHFDHIGGLSEFLNVNNKAKVYIPSSFHGLKNKEVIAIKKPTKIHKDVFSTGELEGIEQSMAVKTDKGLVIIAGCSHPGVEKILDASSQFGKPYALIGGLHGFKQFELIEKLKYICPTHCTRYKQKIKSLYPQKYIEGGAGKVINLK